MVTKENVRLTVYWSTLGIMVWHLLALTTAAQASQSFTFINQTSIGFIPKFAVIKEKIEVASYSGSMVIAPQLSKSAPTTTPYSLNQFFWFASVDNRKVLNHSFANQITLLPSNGEPLTLSLEPNESYEITLIDHQGTLKATVKAIAQKKYTYNNLLKELPTKTFLNHTQLLAPRRNTSSNKAITTNTSMNGDQ